jgi:hypothetical protein
MIRNGTFTMPASDGSLKTVCGRPKATATSSANVGASLN